MQAMLHGFRRIDMTDEDTGRLIAGYSCFISFPRSGVVGVETAKQFVTDEMAGLCSWQPEVNKLVDIDYGPKGIFLGISTVDEE